MLCCSRCEREAPGVNEGITGVQERFRTERKGLVKRYIDIVGLANVDRLNFDVKLTSF